MQAMEQREEEIFKYYENHIHSEWETTVSLTLLEIISKIKIL